MLNLAFIGSRADAERYGAITNRIDGAKWSVYFLLDGPKQTAHANVLGSAIESASIADMLSSHAGDIDAFVIHAPLGTLPELVSAAAQSTRPLLVGPLVAKSNDDLSSLVDSAGKSTLLSACSWRFIPAIQSVKTTIDAGNLGDIGLIRIHRWNSQVTATSHDLASRIIADIDLATWFFGKRPQKIFAMNSTASTAYLQIHLHFDNGGMAVIDEAGAMPNGGDYFSLTVIGGTGAAYADDHRNMNLIVDGVYPHAIRTEQGGVHLARQLQSFVDSIRTEAPYPIRQQDVANVLQITNAALQAAATKQVLTWEESRYV